MENGDLDGFKHQKNNDETTIYGGFTVFTSNTRILPAEKGFDELV